MILEDLTNFVLVGKHRFVLVLISIYIHCKYCCVLLARFMCQPRKAFEKDQALGPYGGTYVCTFLHYVLVHVGSNALVPEPDRSKAWSSCNAGFICWDG